MRVHVDARIFQIGFQAVLLTLGVLLRDFSLLPAQMALALLAASASQAFWLRLFKLPNVGYLSPLITGFGLSLLLRADTLWLHPLVACLAISSKFLIRVRGKHVFNPANFGVGLALLGLPGAWVSPGQWGNDLGLAVEDIAAIESGNLKCGPEAMRPIRQALRRCRHELEGNPDGPPHFKT